MHERRGADGLRSWAIASDKLPRPDALLTGDDSPISGLLAEILVSVPASSIAGGTDEIQRNIISERGQDAARADRRHGQAVQRCSANTVV